MNADRPRPRPRTLSERIAEAQAAELARQAAERAMEASIRRITAPNR